MGLWGINNVCPEVMAFDLLVDGLDEAWVVQFGMGCYFHSVNIIDTNDDSQDIFLEM